MTQCICPFDRAARSEEAHASGLNLLRERCRASSSNGLQPTSGDGLHHQNVFGDVQWNH